MGSYALGLPSSPGLCKTTKSPPEAPYTFAPSSQHPSAEGQQEGQLCLPGTTGAGDWQAKQGFTSPFHQGISDICIKLEPKTLFSKAPRTIGTKKQKVSNPVKMTVMF